MSLTTCGKMENVILLYYDKITQDKVSARGIAEIY